MIREILVQLKRGSKGAHLIFMFNDGNDKKVLSRATGRICLFHELVGGDEVLQINLHPANQIYRIKYEDDKNYKDPDNDKYKELARLFKNKQYQTLAVSKVKPDGSYEYDANPYLQVHQFDYIDETMNRTNNVLTQKRLHRAANIVDGMSLSQQKEVLFHFNQDPTGMTASDIWMRLINHSSGIVLNRDKYDDVQTTNGKVSRSYLEYFVEEYAKNIHNTESDVFLKTLILKALIVKKDDMRSIIEKKSTGYYLGEKPLGGEIHNVINYLRSNAKEKEYVMQMVSKYDEVSNDDIPELLKSRGVKVDIEKETISDVPREEYMAAELQKHRRNLDAARNTYRMVVSDDIDPEQLEKDLEVARGIWGNGKFWKLGDILRDNPTATYEQIKEILKKKKEEKYAARKAEKNVAETT